MQCLIKYFILILILIMIPSSKQSNLHKLKVDIEGQLDKSKSSNHTARRLDFSKIVWYVRPKNLQPQGPGPNYFNDNITSVWLDQKSYLHLKISQQQNKWYCSEIYSEKSYGYGSYIYNVEKGFELIDPRSVVGLFNYLDDSNQIDVELSQWGDPNIPNTQYAIQPAQIQGNLYRFNMVNLNMPVVHAYTWTKDFILFQTFYANTIQQVQNQIGIISKSERLVKQWRYTGKYNPKESVQKVHINFWLFKGKQPISKKDQEIIIRQFRYLPVKSD